MKNSIKLLRKLRHILPYATTHLTAYSCTLRNIYEKCLKYLIRILILPLYKIKIKIENGMSKLNITSSSCVGSFECVSAIDSQRTKHVRANKKNMFVKLFDQTLRCIIRIDQIQNHRFLHISSTFSKVLCVSLSAQVQICINDTFYFDSAHIQRHYSKKCIFLFL